MAPPNLHWPEHFLGPLYHACTHVINMYVPIVKYVLFFSHCPLLNQVHIVLFLLSTTQCSFLTMHNQTHVVYPPHPSFYWTLKPLFFIPKYHNYRIPKCLLPNILPSSPLTSYQSLLATHKIAFPICESMKWQSTCSKDQLPQIKAKNLYMEPTLLATPNHDTISNLGCVYGVWFLNILEAKIIIKKIQSKKVSSN